MTIIITSRCD